MTGLSVLTVGDGDTRLTFDIDKPEERERACKIVTDMLRRGFAILVQTGVKDGKPVYTSATGFDPKTAEYIIADVPDEAVGTPPKRAGKRGQYRRKSAATTPAVAVPRRAGG
jgi:hypothetical protein